MVVLSIPPTTMSGWFCRTIKIRSLRFKDIVSFWNFAATSGAFTQTSISVTKGVLFAAFTCILALGGCIVGTISGAIKGQTTETGFLDGARKGAVAGAIAALELFPEPALDEESLSKVDLLGCFFNGKVFMEWVFPAVANAYLFNISTPETAYRDISDTNGFIRIPGLSQDLVQKLPLHQFSSNKMWQPFDMSCCSICIQDFEDEEFVRVLPICGHLFHLGCVDRWLIEQGSCPMCRTIYVSYCNLTS